jgi:hypothetical protein
MPRFNNNIRSALNRSYSEKVHVLPSNNSLHLGLTGKTVSLAEWLRHSAVSKTMAKR